MKQLYVRLQRLALREMAGRREASVPDILYGVVHQGIRYAIERTVAMAYLRQCDEVGIGARSAGRPRIVNQGIIRIGEHFGVLNNWIPTEIITASDGVIEIGSRVGINYGCSALMSLSARETPEVLVALTRWVRLRLPAVCDDDPKVAVTRSKRWC